MQYTVRFLIDAPTQAIGQAAKTAAEQAITGAGATIQGTDVSRRQASYTVVGVVCDTGERWTWQGEADNPAEAEAAALAAKPASSKVAALRRGEGQ